MGIKANALTMRQVEALTDTQPRTATLVTVPVPPSANNLFPTARSGRRFTSADYKAWQAVADPIFERMKPAERYPVEIWARLTGKGVHGSRDVSNIEKAIGDALARCGVIRDDKLKYVAGCHQIYRADDGLQRVEVWYTEPEPEASE